MPRTSAAKTEKRERGYPATDYERIFHPKTIAVLGVSAEDGFGFGAGMFRAIASMGFEGKLYPVNPKGGAFDGQTLYPSVEDIPEPVDFAVIAVAARHVPAALSACLRKGVAGAEIPSSGFSELGTEEGIELEKQVGAIAAKGIRVVGPNCFGIYCPRSGLTLLPGPDLSRTSGPVAFIAQSGGISIDFAHAGKWMGVTFSKMVSFGNGADLREAELVNYFTKDEETKVISLYIEGIKDGEKFFHEIKKAAAKKPVVVLKGGLSRAGGRTVASHTASMGGSRQIWQSVLKQAGVVQVHDTEEMAQTSLAFAMLPLKSFRSISIVGGGGAIGVTACDTAETYGIDIPPLSGDLRASIESLLPRPGSSAINPIDVANPFVAPETLKAVLLASAGDPQIDLQIIVSLLFHYKTIARYTGQPITKIAPFRELASAVRDVVQQTGKPVVAVLPNAKRGLDSRDIIEMIAMTREEYVRFGIPVFDELHDAIRALAHINTYYEGRTR